MERSPRWTVGSSFGNAISVPLCNDTTQCLSFLKDGIASCGASLSSEQLHHSHRRSTDVVIQSQHPCDDVLGIRERLARPFVGKISLQPIFLPKILNAGKLVFVIGYDGIAKCQSLRCNQQIVASDGAAGSLKLRPKQPVFPIGWRFEWQDFKCSQNNLQLSRKSGRVLLCGPIAQFGSNNDAGANFVVTNLANVLRNSSVRIPNEIRNNVRIEQVAHQRSPSASGVGSERGGKSSSTGLRVASTARSDLGGRGSMISFSPSFRMTASWVRSSNSRGIRTA